METKYEKLDADITGKVIDTNTGKPIKDASILLTTPKGNYSAVTNAEGVYIIRDIFIGEKREKTDVWWSGKTHVESEKVKNYILTLTCTGYKQFNREIILGTGLNKIDDIFMNIKLTTDTSTEKEHSMLDIKLKPIRMEKQN